MPGNERGPGRKTARVQVHYFPKRERAAALTLEEAIRLDDRTKTLTVPEFRADLGLDEELVTEPNYVSADPLSDAGRATPPWPRRTSSGERRGGRSKDKRKKGKGPRKANPPLRSKAPADPQRLAEKSLFGHQLFEMGRLEEARVVFEGLVEVAPQDAFPHTMLGTIYLALGDQDRALALFEAALALEPDELAALVYRGEIRLNQRKVKTALLDLNRAVTLGLGDDPFVDRARRLIRMAQELGRRPPR